MSDQAGPDNIEERRKARVWLPDEVTLVDVDQMDKLALIEALKRARVRARALENLLDSTLRWYLKGARGRGREARLFIESNLECAVFRNDDLEE